MRRPQTAPPAARVLPAFDGSPARLLGAAVTLAVLMSTQFFFQPFVWRNWPLGEIGAGWMAVLGQRLVVALAIAVGLAAVAPVRIARPLQRPLLLAVAVAAGAMAGEALTASLAGAFDGAAFAERSLRWSVIALALAGISLLWRQGADDAARLARQQADAARLAAASIDAEAAALQRQIEPHFLFNTLATARRHYRVGNDAGQHLLERLLDYIDESFAAADTRWSTVGAEIELARAYLDVCSARMGPRLDVAVDVPDALRRLPLPPLMLVTLAENAIKHGIAPLQAGGTVVLRAWRSGPAVVLSVEDDGAGLSGGGGNGIGLANIATRLHLLYGPAASVTLAGRRPRGAVATLTVPSP